jgi:Protein of unknown function (DUF3754)
MQRAFTMSEAKDKRMSPGDHEHFIPIRLEDIVSGLIAHSQVSESEDRMFQRFCKIYIALFHARFHARLQGLKHCYLPFSPDRATVSVDEYSRQQLDELQRTLFTDVADILTKANYTPITENELNRVLAETSPYGLKVIVDFSDFEELQLYYRGLAIQTKTQRGWRNLWLRARTIEIPIYRRLFALLKFNTDKESPKEDAAAWQRFKEWLVDYWAQLFEFRFAEAGDNKAYIYLKLFKDIPRSDLEMLFPNTRVQMQVFDKITLGVSGGGGIVSGLLALLTKMARPANPYAIALTIAGFLGIVWREIAKIFSSRNKYMANLAKSLYFHNLDNNLGVLAKLMKAGLMQQTPKGLLRASDMVQAINRLDREWDDIFAPVG